MEYEMMLRAIDENTMPNTVSANVRHLPCLMLLDTSGSMMGKPVEELTNALHKFKQDVCMNSTMREALDVAIVEFNSNEHVVQSFVPIKDMEPVNLTAKGSTEMASAIRRSIDMVIERSEYYSHMGIKQYTPWIIMVSDGAPTDDIGLIEKELHDLEAKRKLKFFSLGVGNCDLTTLRRLSGLKVMKRKGYDFTYLFDWVRKRMARTVTPALDEEPQTALLSVLDDEDASRCEA